ncbi:unnamed protein product [Thlaspi arvense]|uniref:Pulmonary surfactant-associated protein B n=1 Tax=Thlaspi arvense TaxID=13288 RepID=A0AAU9SUQ0_THLAR|nr:unnamed protein product [Thlaspi arvense]
MFQESMGPKAGALVIFLLGLTLLCDARSFFHSTLSEEVSRKEDVCTLCEEYVTDALTYLKKNETQAQIMEDFHDRCSQMRGFSKQCITLVDYYLPLFFLQVESFQPHYFCKRMNLCGRVVTLVEESRQDTCGVCHKTVLEILIKLQDPDTQLDIVELLLKSCKSLKKYEKKAFSHLIMLCLMLLPGWPSEKRHLQALTRMSGRENGSKPARFGGFLNV